MPREEQIPPSKRVDELKSQITKDIWEKFNEMPSLTASDREKRGIEMINYLVRELAISMAKIEYLEK